MQGVLGLKCEARIGEVEIALRDRGERWVIGVDEAGRGPLAGPVGVGAVLLDLQALDWVQPLNDSKQLTESAREELLPQVYERSAAHALVMMAPAEVDSLNVLWASMEGMRRAVTTILEARPDVAGCEVLVDGNRPMPRFTGRQRPLVKGDARSWAIAAASIIAKVERDRLMVALGERHPEYGFAQHKGYPTRAHLAALREHGPCPEHRRSFAPVAAALASAAEAEG